MQKFTPCLWFNNNGEEAVKLYSSVFKNSKTKVTTRYGEAAAPASGQKKGTVLTVLFELDGQEFLALNGGPHFKFTPAVSLFVACENEKEIDMFWAALSKGGVARMELNKYPFAEKYGWCEDKYGVSWQLILGQRKQKISPAFLFVGNKVGRAEEAIKFYTSLFKNSKINMLAHDENTKALVHGTFTLADYDFIAMESTLKHDFDFNPALSLMVNCETQEEIDQLWNKLSADKEWEQCGWLKDKFGISWQIVPTVLGRIMADPDSAKTDRVMEAVLKMKKLDIKTLEKAYQVSK